MLPSFEITIKNYRRFSAGGGAKFSLDSGITGFVGVNNSGKSSILRFFLDFRLLFSLLGDGAILGQCIATALGPLDHVINRDEFLSRSGGFDLEVEFNLTPELVHGIHPDLMPTQARLTIPRQRERPITLTLVTANGKSLPASDSTEGTLRLFSFEAATRCLNYSTFGAVAYLGGLVDLFRELSQTTYIGPFRNALNLDAADNYFDIAVGKEFVEQWKHLKGGASRDKIQKALGITRTLQRLFEISDLELNVLADDTNIQVIADNESFRLDEMGSGMAQFLMTLTAIVSRQSSIILIDEPELGLHPSLQLEFIRSIASAASAKIMFATHSMSLARSAAERIYCVHKEPGLSSSLDLFHETSRLSELLGELNFRGYRELGYRRLLLVEGASELRLITEFLRRLGKDHQVVPLSMNGSNAILRSDDVAFQLQEMKRITPDVSALIDSEKKSSEDKLSSVRERFVQSCVKAGIDCHVLERRAIENYFPARAIAAVCGPGYAALGPFEKLSEAKHPWHKAQSWKIAMETSVQELAGTDLHSFLVAL